MERDELVIWLNELENKFPVNEWKFENIHLWPLIKIKLALLTPQQITKFQEEPKKYQILKLLRGFWDLLRLFFKQKSQSKTKLFCLASHFRYNDGNKFVNRYFNQMIEEANSLNYDFRFGEYGNTTKGYREKLDYKSKTIFFENFKYVALVWREFRWKSYNKKLQMIGFEEFLQEVQSKLGENIISKKDILKQFVYIYILKSFYKKFLIKTSITEVYMLCYYVSEMYAMNLAASDLKIPSWDIQHGGQGKLHVAYSNFKRVPKTGYKLLPQNFWCWDLSSSIEIQKWTKSQNYHQVYNKGNPWLEYCSDNYPVEIFSGEKIILFTMQPTGEALLDEYIIETIRNTPNNFKWWLRLHPRQFSRKDELLQVLANNKILQKVEIDKANVLPLPALLNHCYLHISKFSGSILEGFLIGVKTIIIDEVGVESFPEVAVSPLTEICLSRDSKDLLKSMFSQIEMPESLNGD